MNTGIYRITCLENGSYYIGRANNFTRRFIRHKSDLRCGRHDNQILQRIFDKYGLEPLKFEVLVICKDPYMTELEQTLIDEYFNDSLCINLSRSSRGGGTKGCGLGRIPWNKGKTGVYSEETKELMKVAKKLNPINPWPETRSRISPLKGRKLSEDHKRKIGATKIGNKNRVGKSHSEETKAKISKSMTKRRGEG